MTPHLSFAIRLALVVVGARLVVAGFSRRSIGVPELLTMGGLLIGIVLGDLVHL